MWWHMYAARDVQPQQYTAISTIAPSCKQGRWQKSQIVAAALLGISSVLVNLARVGRDSGRKGAFIILENSAKEVGN